MSEANSHDCRCWRRAPVTRPVGAVAGLVRSIICVAAIVSSVAIVFGAGCGARGIANNDKRATRPAAKTGPRVIGAPAPSWALVDRQRKSARYHQSYGVEAGTVTAVAFLNASCGFCRAQASDLAQVVNGLASEGRRVNVLIVNSSDGVEQLGQLLASTPLSVLQDTPDVDVWKQYQAAKGDMAIYDSGAKLWRYLEFAVGGEMNLVLSERDGFMQLTSLLRQATEQVAPGG